MVEVRYSGILSHYITDSKPASKWLQQQWEEFLGKTYSDVLAELLKAGVIDDSSPNVKITKCTNKQLKELLRKFHLKISGKKDQLIDRILQHIPAEVEKIVQPIEMYVCTEKGRIIASEWKNDIQKEGQKADDQIREYLRMKKISEVLEVMDNLRTVIPSPLHQYYGLRENSVTLKEWKLWKRKKLTDFTKKYDIERLVFMNNYEGSIIPNMSSEETLEAKVTIVMSQFFLDWNFEEKYYFPNDKEKQQEIRNREQPPIEMCKILSEICSQSVFKSQLAESIKKIRKLNLEYLSFLKKEGVTEVKIYEFVSDMDNDIQHLCPACTLLVNRVYPITEVPIIPNPSCEKQNPCRLDYIGYGEQWEEYRERHKDDPQIIIEFDSATGRGGFRLKRDDE